MAASSSRTVYEFTVPMDACGTSTGNAIAGATADLKFGNILVFQMDPDVQEVWDQARRITCEWTTNFQKSLTFQPFSVNMLDVVTVCIIFTRHLI